MIYRLIVVFSIFMASCAQLLLKRAALANYKSPIFQYANPKVVGGYAIMFASMAINIYAMSKGVMAKELSILESLSYIFVPLMSWLFLKEQLTIRKAVSAIVIILGILVFLC